jgi:2'-5' RNA ligase
MRHRVFIAVNLSDDIKRKLEDFQRKWLDLPARWTKKDNLHITLLFLGYLSDEELLEVCRISQEVASRNLSFEINLNKILYGPPKKMPPRMIWVEGEKSKEFASLRKDLEKSLSYAPPKEEHAFSPHITLARIKTWQWKEIEPEERPQIEEELRLILKVDSIEVMESDLKRGGPQYAILESWPLKN